MLSMIGHPPGDKPLNDGCPSKQVRSTRGSLMLLSVNDVVAAPGHVFLSYARADSASADRLQQVLEAAGISVWRDNNLWPGEDWRIKIRQAVTHDAFAFIVCFSAKSVHLEASYQNEELLLAIEQARLHRPDVPWLFPVRLDDCLIPDIDLGGGRTLASIQRADLFGDYREEGIARLVAAVLRALSPGRDVDRSPYYSCFLSYSARDRVFVRRFVDDLSNAGISCWLDTKDMHTGGSLEGQIYRGLSNQDKLLLVLSRFSVQSRWVEVELRKALSLERERGNEIIFPLRLDDSVFDSRSPLLGDLIKDRHIADFEGWQDEDEYHRHLKQLVRDLTISAAVELERGL
jgi:hypothetical protein